MGFEVSPKYFQFLRTSLPIVSTLYAIGKELPGSRKSKIIRGRILMMVPKGVLQYSLGRTWNPARLGGREISSRFYEMSRIQALKNQGAAAKGGRAGTLKCEMLFAPTN